MLAGFGITLGDVVARINLVLTSATVIVAVSLLAYLLVHNFRNPVARSFCLLLAFVSIVYSGDVFLDAVNDLDGTRFWLRFQWLGIAFVPAAYLHFSDTILRTTNSFSTWRRWLVIAAYSVGGLALALVLWTTWLVRRVAIHPTNPQASYFEGGPLFGPFAWFFFLASAYGALNVFRAWRRCLTPTSRRRMSYVLVSVAAPLSVFPYLMLTSPVVDLPSRPLIFGALAGLSNIAITWMTTVMAYGVAYHGVLIPDRAVKRNLIKFLIQAPVLGSCVILAMLLVPPVERILGLPRDTVLIFVVVIGIVAFQLFVSVSRPLVDRLIFWGDWSEVHWLRRLDERLLTSTDLRQLLENIVTSIVDVLRVESSFVAVTQGGRLVLDTTAGSEAQAEASLDALDDAGQVAISEGATVERGGYWLVPLQGTEPVEGERPLLGVLGLGRNPHDLTDREQAALVSLIEQAERALEDRRLQQNIFRAVRQLETEIETLQRARSQMRYLGSPPTDAETSPLDSPDFVAWVRDALSHYWGGPKLANSPLLRLRIVRAALESDNNPARAVRAILDEAIERLKPDSERSLQSVDWTLYNILEMKFIKGQRTRDIAARLAMSESDLYRKQRVAIEQLALQIASMETAEEVGGGSPRASATVDTAAPS
ncbi:MAG: hypothetical protein KIT87_07585 [Anaerolineae bacterium]|nr:hypothetical protein [Anaerolineae bacterium]